MSSSMTESVVKLMTSPPPTAVEYLPPSISDRLLVQLGRKVCFFLFSEFYTLR